MPQKIENITDETFRYEQVIDFIQELINSGTLLPGTKAPSLRRVSKAQAVSVTTALHAYRMLESQGVLEARPQSGFYVRQQVARSIKTPSVMRATTRERVVKAGKQVASMFAYAGDPNLAPLGCAIPGPNLLASSQLDKFLARAARVDGKNSNTYAPPEGLAALRDVISRRSILWGQNVSPDEILITCGCTEALHLALKSTTRPHDTIAVESPNYFGFLPILQALQLKVVEIPTDAVSGLSLDALESVLSTNQVKTCLFSSAFNNPLGCLITEEKKSAVLKLLNRYRATLVEDDIYGDIFFAGERPRPYSSLKEARDVIYCSSFSKTVAPGYRIGWIASSGRFDSLLETKYSTTLCGPVLPQLALANFLNGGAYDNHLRGLRRHLHDNIRAMSNAISESFPQGTRISRPEGGFVLWVELPKHVNTRTLFNQAIREGICFAPGDLFTTTDNYKSCMRLSCGYEWDAALARAIWKLGDMVKH